MTALGIKRWSQRLVEFGCEVRLIGSHLRNRGIAGVLDKFRLQGEIWLEAGQLDDFAFRMKSLFRPESND